MIEDHARDIGIFRDAEELRPSGEWPQVLTHGRSLVLGFPMHDPRFQQLAETIIHHAVALKPGERILIEANGVAATPLLHALVATATRAGGVPHWHNMDEATMRHLLLNGSEEQLKQFGAMHKQVMTQMQAYVAIRASENIFRVISRSSG